MQCLIVNLSIQGHFILIALSVYGVYCIYSLIQNYNALHLVCRAHTFGKIPKQIAIIRRAT